MRVPITEDGGAELELFAPVYLVHPDDVTEEHLAVCLYDDTDEGTEPVILCCDGEPSVGDEFTFDGITWRIADKARGFICEPLLE